MFSQENSRDSGILLPSPFSSPGDPFGGKKIILLPSPFSVVNPVSRFVPGADGAVDLYLLPAYDDIAGLYFTDGEWKLHYIFHDASAVVDRVPEPEALPLSEDTVTRVLDELVAHAA